MEFMRIKKKILEQIENNKQYKVQKTFDVLKEVAERKRIIKEEK